MERVKRRGKNLNQFNKLYIDLSDTNSFIQQHQNQKQSRSQKIQEEEFGGTCQHSSEKAVLLRETKAVSRKRLLPSLEKAQLEQCSHNSSQDDLQN